MGRPSMEALAMAGADWARYRADGGDDDDGEEDDAPPPGHLRPFEAFLETVVPADMVLAFGREEAARARRGERRRSHREDVEEKLRLWARAVARDCPPRARPGYPREAAGRAEFARSRPQGESRRPNLAGAGAAGRQARPPSPSECAAGSKPSLGKKARRALPEQQATH